MKHIPLTASLLALAVSLSACSSVKKELGVGRNSPDEFAVVKRAPLTLPPDYELRPPADAATAAAATAETPTAQARDAVLGKPGNPAEKGAADAALLEKLGAAGASPDIRKQIDEDNGYIALQNRSVADKLIFWNDEPQAAPGNIPSPVVDAAAEAERLKKNKEEGKPVNAGDVPVIEKKKGTIDKLF